MKSEAYIKFREEDDQFELYDEETKKSYWIELEVEGESIKLSLIKITNYGG